MMSYRRYLLQRKRGTDIIAVTQMAMNVDYKHLNDSKHQENKFTKRV